MAVHAGARHPEGLPRLPFPECAPYKYEDFKKAGCEVYGVSCDTHFVHKAWHDASERIKKIQYPTLW